MVTKSAVGLDLSYSGTGVVVISPTNEAIGFEFKAGNATMSFPERATSLVNQIFSVIPNSNDCIVYEEGAAYSAEFNAFMLGELAGVINYELGKRGYAVTLVPPTTLKKYATGSGVAQKHYVAAHVAKKWGFISPSNNITDAFVLAQMAHDGWHPEEKVKKSRKKKKSPKEDFI